MNTKRIYEALTRRVGDIADYLQFMNRHHVTIPHGVTPHPNDISRLVVESRRLLAQAERLDLLVRCALPTNLYPAVKAKLAANEQIMNDDDDIQIVVEV